MHAPAFGAADQSNVVLTNGGSGAFTAGAGGAVSTGTERTFALALADVDGDGDLDLFVISPQESNRSSSSGLERGQAAHTQSALTAFTRTRYTGRQLRQHPSLPPPSGPGDKHRQHWPKERVALERRIWELHSR